MDVLRCLFGDVDVMMLSGGERCCVVFACLLLSVFDLLLFDELMNHLDVELVVWFEQHFVDYKGMIVVVIYDWYFFDNVVGWIFEFDCGYGILFKGNYLSWFEQK